MPAIERVPSPSAGYFSLFLLCSNSPPTLSELPKRSHGRSINEIPYAVFTEPSINPPPDFSFRTAHAFPNTPPALKDSAFWPIDSASRPYGEITSGDCNVFRGFLVTFAL